MKRIPRILGTALLGLALVTLGAPTAIGGRTGGPAAETGTVPGNMSVFYNIEFNSNEPAIVSIAGQGRTSLDLFIYDSDGNEARGVGFAGRKVATMNVYRGGIFRIEVRNLGSLSNTFQIKSN